MKRETRLRPERGGKFFGPVHGLTPLDAPKSDRGICFLCKRPVDNRRAFAVCSECDEAQEVRASWALDYGAIEAHFQGSDCRECFCPGWLWMNEEDDASFNIERCDTCRAFRDDTDAARAMVLRCCIRGVEWP